MTEIIIIVAIADNNIIGSNNDIPWRIKEDFQHFKEITLGHPCIMGDKTYESLPKRPLPGRENIVLTFNKEYHPKDTTIFHDFNEAIKYVNDKNEKKAFIIGGATIYKIGLKVADTLEITRVHKNPLGDTYFPEINYDEWEMTNEEKHDGYSFQTYKRKRKI